jgi:hypothetical protein
MSNKLLEDAPRRAGTVTVEMLHQLASDLNCKRFVIDSGKPYFVNRMANGDGTLTHFLDR